MRDDLSHRLSTVGRIPGVRAGTLSGQENQMAQIGHRDATRLHEFVLDLVHDNESPDGSWDDEFVVSLIDRLSR